MKEKVCHKWRGTVLKYSNCGYLSAEFRSCVRVEVAVLGCPS